MLLGLACWPICWLSSWASRRSSSSRACCRPIRWKRCSANSRPGSYMDAGTSRCLAAVADRRVRAAWLAASAVWPVPAPRRASGDFGPSFAMYPTPVSSLIRKALPWTFGLLLLSHADRLGVGQRRGPADRAAPDRACSRALEASRSCIYPIPYYILALVLSILFSYVWQVFPLTTTIAGTGLAVRLERRLGLHPARAFDHLSWCSAGGCISMKALARRIADEDPMCITRG